MFSPKQKNKLVDAVRKLGLDLSHFTVPEENSGVGLVHTSTGFCFYIEVVQLPSDTDIREQLIAYYTPDYRRINLATREVNIYIKTWDEGITHLNRWLAWIKEECFDEQGSPIEPQLREPLKGTAMPLPTLAPLHLTIQQTASGLWANNHYRQAVLDSCIALDKAVQDKASLPATTTGVSLMTTAFSANQPLIRLSQDRNEQAGFMNLYQGSVQAIRNHYAHNLTEIDPARALEWLSFISALFYKLDEAQPTLVSPTP